MIMLLTNLDWPVSVRVSLQNVFDRVCVCFLNVRVKSQEMRVRYAGLRMIIPRRLETQLPFVLPPDSAPSTSRAETMSLLSTQLSASFVIIRNALCTAVTAFSAFFYNRRFFDGRVFNSKELALFSSASSTSAASAIEVSICMHLCDVSRT